MFKNKKKNIKKEEAIAESNVEANVETKLVLTAGAVHNLLDKIDKGYTPTDEEIAALKKVESIRLYKIHKSIDLLANLKVLDLRNTRITDLRKINKLTNLQELNLRGTPITNLSGIEKLTNLQELNLSQTQIDDLSDIENLTNLRWLSLSQTQIDSNELEKLAKLKNLTHLDLMYLKLAKIPPRLLELNLPFDTTSVLQLNYDRRGIFLYGTELTQQPISLFEQDRSLIDEYYKMALRSSENSPLA